LFFFSFSSILLFLRFLSTPIFLVQACPFPLFPAHTTITIHGQTTRSLAGPNAKSLSPANHRSFFLLRYTTKSSSRDFFPIKTDSNSNCLTNPWIKIEFFAATSYSPVCSPDRTPSPINTQVLATNFEFRIVHGTLARAQGHTVALLLRCLPRQPDAGRSYPKVCLYRPTSSGSRSLNGDTAH
jgi:hypothetical protein